MLRRVLFMKFTEAILKYGNYKAIRYPTAARNYTWIMGRFDIYINKILEEINNDDVTAYQVYIKNKFQDSTQALEAAALRSFFDFTNGRGWTNINLKEILVPRVVEKIPTYVVQSEFETLCDITKDMPRELCILRLLWFTGVRVSELCDMRIEEMDLEERCAKIQAKKAFRPKTVFWDERTNGLIKAISKPGKEYLFYSTHGGKISTRQIQRIIQRLVDKAGIKKRITPHSFRHGCAHQLLDIGVDLPALQDLLGHKNPESIFRYTRRLQEDIKEKGREAVRRREKISQLKTLAKELDLENMLKEA